ncbi:hypothetical protein Pmani_002013 [Petrolisthes manimaculis]|uniref:SAP domain-containing protein n=1 Tax=Petrolisthes manimaculis TaxID=1843537 RepID=A0AAE1QLM8_9EUCA|nr:hypothetical protein Pmani_002013 [Petrolisthes manimaculis]
MDDASLSKMKVADLKKELKHRGLTTTGNKTELIERLQLAIAAGDHGNLGEAEGGEEDFDEEEILGGEEEEEILGEEGMEELTPQEEEAALVGIRIKDSTKLMEQNEPEKKKISLKRSEPSLPAPASAPSPPPPVVEEPTPQTKEETEGEEGKAEKENEEQPARKLIKLDSPDKNVLEVRAQKFGLTMSETSKVQARAARFGINASSNGTSITKPAKLSMETGGLDVDRLKARAKRFGEVTSKSLVKLSEQEKKVQRQARFSGSDSSSSDKAKAEGNTLITSVDVGKLTTRAERFGTAAGKDENEVKKKRAERFAVK